MTAIFVLCDITDILPEKLREMISGFQPENEQLHALANRKLQEAAKWQSEAEYLFDDVDSLSSSRDTVGDVLEFFKEFPLQEYTRTGIGLTLSQLYSLKDLNVVTAEEEKIESIANHIFEFGHSEIARLTRIGARNRLALVYAYSR